MINLNQKGLPEKIELFSLKPLPNYSIVGLNSQELITAYTVVSHHLALILQVAYYTVLQMTHILHKKFLAMLDFVSQEPSGRYATLARPTNGWSQPMKQLIQDYQLIKFSSLSSRCRPSLTIGMSKSLPFGRHSRCGSNLWGNRQFVQTSLRHWLIGLAALTGIA